MENDDRLGRARSFLIGGVVGASAALATARLLPQLGRDLAADRLEAGLDGELRDARAHRSQSDDSDFHRAGAYRARRER